MNPWTNRLSNAQHAKEHTENMQKLHAEDIRMCIEESIIYGGPDRMPERYGEKRRPGMYFLNTDSVSALLLSQTSQKAVLNFASFKNPGGAFMAGSIAQEEALCHESYLYSVLLGFPEYYEWNAEHKNRALYENRAIYTPQVLFERADRVDLCDVITCAAPNKRAAQKYCNVSDTENFKVLKSRIEFVRDIAEENSVETLITGAYGCGVFRQNPEDVCRVYEEVFKSTSIKNIVFAIPGDASDRNVMAFADMAKRTYRW